MAGRTEAMARLVSAGEIALDESPVRFTRDFMPRDVERLPPGSVKRLHCGGDESRITLNPTAIGGVRSHIQLHFMNDRLKRIELMATNEDVPEVMTAGGAWSRENELARKRFHEQWAARSIQRDLTIKPWIDPDLPEPVMPAIPGPEHPRYVKFDWGEVGSYFDEKSCAALLIVTYSSPTSAAT